MESRGASTALAFPKRLALHTVFKRNSNSARCRHHPSATVSNESHSQLPAETVRRTESRPQCGYNEPDSNLLPEKGAT